MHMGAQPVGLFVRISAGESRAVRVNSWEHPDDVQSALLGKRRVGVRPFGPGFACEATAGRQLREVRGSKTA